MGIPGASFHRIAKFDLGLTPFEQINIHRLTREDEKKRSEIRKMFFHYMTLANL